MYIYIYRYIYRYIYIYIYIYLYLYIHTYMKGISTNQRKRLRETHGLHKHNSIQSHLRWYAQDCQIVVDRWDTQSLAEVRKERRRPSVDTRASSYLALGNHGTDGVTDRTASATQRKECAPGRDACFVQGMPDALTTAKCIRRGAQQGNPSSLVDTDLRLGSRADTPRAVNGPQDSPSPDTENSARRRLPSLPHE